MPVDKVHEVVSYLRKNGYTRSEAVPDSERVERGWPVNIGFFRLVDAHLRLCRETESYYDMTGSAVDYEYVFVRG